MSNQSISRSNMIKQQLRTGNVLNPTILALYEDIARDDFVPSLFKPFAYVDMHIELPHQQCMMTPLEEAKLLQALALTGNEVVLEVGTGTGFLTALLSQLSKQVISIDYFASFSAGAQVHLAKHQCNNVTLETGDASSGWMVNAPYDVIVYTGALSHLTETQRLQVTPGGKLFAIVGSDPMMQGQLHTLDHHDQWRVEVIFETCLPFLIDKSKTCDFVF